MSNGRHELKKFKLVYTMDNGSKQKLYEFSKMKVTKQLLYNYSATPYS